MVTAALVCARVTNTMDGNVWSWSPTKFDSRLFLIRDLYRQHMEDVERRKVRVCVCAGVRKCDRVSVKEWVSECVSIGVVYACVIWFSSVLFICTDNMHGGCYTIPCKVYVCVCV